MSKEIETYNPTEESVVVYRSADNAVQLDVQLADETVWLTQAQMAMLFDSTKQNVSLHINNIYKEGELSKEATVKDYLTVQNEGGRQITRRVLYYNLDVIISVGYRVKSKRGTQFRQWANRVLKDYLLRGYAMNPHLRYIEQRIDNKLQEHSEQIHELQNRVDFFVRTALPPKEGIFVDGQIFDAYEFVTRLIKSAKKNILLIDNYVDESVLTMMSEKASGVRVDIYTKEVSKPLALAADKFNAQYGDLEIHVMHIFHDRFLIIDDTTIYLIGASLKDAGKKLFAFTQLSPKLIEELKNKIL